MNKKTDSLNHLAGNPWKNRVVFFVLGIICILVFVSFSTIVKHDLLTAFDFDMTVKIQDKIPVRYDAVLSTLSLIGSFEVLTFIIALVLIISRKFLGLFSVAFFFFLAHVTEVIGKAFLMHPGPPFMFFRTETPFLFPSSYIPQETGIEGSYPSGHSLRTIFLATILLFLIIKNNRIPFFLKFLLCSIIVTIALTMLISRVSLGEHWTSDVIGGTLLGLAFALLSLPFLGAKNNRSI